MSTAGERTGFTVSTRQEVDENEPILLCQYKSVEEARCQYQSVSGSAIRSVKVGG